MVGYATAAGSTAGTAERIAKVIASAGHDVTCRPAGSDLDLSGVDALVLGGAVHNMAWLPDARLPRDPPVWCFSVGSVEPSGVLTRLLARREAQRVQAGFPAGLPVRDHRVFRGIVAMEGVTWWGRLFYRAVSGRAGDHHNWRGVEKWATDVADELRRGDVVIRVPERRRQRGQRTRRATTPGFDSEHVNRGGGGGSPRFPVISIATG